MNDNAFSFTLRDQDHLYPELPQFPSLLGKHVVLRPVPGTREEQLVAP
jgi:hypothetical protein